MTWPLIDYHSHICIFPIDEMVDTAVALGVREYGISEHIFQLDEGQSVFPHLHEEGRHFAKDEYVNLVEAFRDRSPIDLRLGLEVDFVPGTEDAVRQVLAGVEWDYLIGSIHQIADIDIFEHTPESESEGHRLWRAYYGLFVEAATSGMFDILSHPVRNSLLNVHLPDDVDDLLAEVAHVAAVNDVALELNGEDVTIWPEFVERLAIACGRAGCYVSLGSDAHEPSDVGRGLQLATEIAVRVRVPGIATFRGRQRQVISLDELR